MRYWPALSVVTAREPSIRAGLLASIETPGMTAPELSLTTPAIALCARSGAGKKRVAAKTTLRHPTRERIVSSHRVKLQTQLAPRRSDLFLSGHYLRGKKSDRLIGRRYSIRGSLSVRFL